jgi:hypothetical protein
MMVAGCRCLKENLDELRIESVRYGRVTGKPEVIPDQKSAFGKAEVPFGACDFRRITG